MRTTGTRRSSGAGPIASFSLPIPDACDPRQRPAQMDKSISSSTPPPDMVPQLKSSGFTVGPNVTPHVWPYHFT